MNTLAGKTSQQSAKVAKKSVAIKTFAKGASLKDPVSLFNSSLEGKVRRAIDLHEGDPVNEAALTHLIRAAVALNRKGKALKTSQ